MKKKEGERRKKDSKTVPGPMKEAILRGMERNPIPREKSGTPSNGKSNMIELE